MDDPFLVGGRDGAGQRLDQARGRQGGQRRPPEPGSQAASVAVFQGEERQPVLLTDLEHLDDVGVLQAGDGFGLGAKAGQLNVAGVRPGEDHLEGHLALQLDLPRTVHDAHAAPPQLGQDFVAGKAKGRSLGLAAVAGGRPRGLGERRHGGGFRGIVGPLRPGFGLEQMQAGVVTGQELPAMRAANGLARSRDHDGKRLATAGAKKRVHGVTRCQDERPLLAQYR